MAAPIQPEGQSSVHTAWPGSPVYLPGWQARQAVGAVEPTRGLAVPGLQAEQLGEAGEVEKDPAGQEVQEATEVARREGWKVPAGQLAPASVRLVCPG